MAALAGTGARTLAPPEMGSMRIARWLLVVVVLDLVLTRTIVRLAIFVPKGEPWATAGSIAGGVGALVDALVPVVGLLLLGALLVDAGRGGHRWDGVVLAGTAVVAAGGLALIVLPPSPAIGSGLDLLVAALATALGARAALRAPGPRLARAAVAVLAASVGLAALARVLAAASGPGAGIAPEPAAAVAAAGSLLYVGGGALLGLAGMPAIAAEVRDGGRHPVRAIAQALLSGLVAATVVLGLAVRSPMTWGALATWSLGLTAAVSAAAVAAAAGLAVAGLPALHRRQPQLATGGAIVLAAGYGLASSGLLLATLLGLVVAARRS